MRPVSCQTLPCFTDYVEKQSPSPLQLPPFPAQIALGGYKCWPRKPGPLSELLPLFGPTFLIQDVWVRGFL